MSETLSRGIVALPIREARRQQGLTPRAFLTIRDTRIAPTGLWLSPRGSALRPAGGTVCSRAQKAPSIPEQTGKGWSLLLTQLAG